MSIIIYKLPTYSKYMYLLKMYKPIGKNEKKNSEKTPLSELQWDKIHTKIVQFSEAILCTFCLKIYVFI